MAKDSHKSHKKHRHHKSRKRSRSGSDRENVENFSTDLSASSDQGNTTRTGVDVSLSIEETNALRAKLGLAPLETDDSSAPGDRHVDNQSENYVHAPAKDLKRLKESELFKEKISIQKEKRSLYEKLSQEKALSSADNETSVQSWVEKMREKERTKKQAQERAKLLMEMDEQLGVSNLVDTSLGTSSNRKYKSEDLTGLKVEHNIDRISDGRSVILTLKDKDILEDDADVLVNVNIVDDEKADINRENLRKAAGLAGIADQEDEDVLMGLRAKSLLSKYDSVIDGPNKSQFVIGQDGSYVPENERRLKELEMHLSKNKHSLPDMELRVASEFYTDEEMAARFKKRKRRVKAIRERLTADDLAVEPTVEIGHSDLGSRSSRELRLQTHPRDEESKADTTKINILSTSTQPSATQEELLEDRWDADDLEPDELRGNLEKTINRIIQSKPVAIPKPEEVAAKLLVRKQDPDTQNSNSDQNPSGSTGGNRIVFDSTAEFYKSINLGFQESMSRNASRVAQFPPEEPSFSHNSLPLAPMKYEPDGNDSDVPMDQSDSDADEETNHKTNATNRWQTVGEDGPNGIRAQSKASNGFPSTSSTSASEPLGGVLDDEPRLDSGVFSALRLAAKKGYIDKDKEKRTGSGTMVNLMAKHFVQEEIRYDDIDAKFAKRNRYSGPLSDFKELNHYKPDVKLEYVDELGRELNAKEAFRQLSHKFHGKGSGKNKTEKRMKKIKEEFLLKASTSSDTPLGTAEKLSKKLQSMASPYVILSGKNAAVKKLTK